MRLCSLLVYNLLSWTLAAAFPRQVILYPSFLLILQTFFPSSSLSFSVSPPHTTPIIPINHDFSIPPDTPLDINSPVSSSPSNILEPSSFALTSSTHSYHVVTRSQTGHLRSCTYPDFHLYYSTHHSLRALHAGVIISKPHSYAQAAAIPEWHLAMECEFQALLKNETWTLCPRPPDKNVVSSKWVFKSKRRLNGSIEKLKARLVVVGYLQRNGIDFFDTFSPVIKPSTVHMVLVLAVSFNGDIRQLDVSNAFLHGILDEEVYMAQPKGFEDPTNPQFVCKLHKSIMD